MAFRTLIAEDEPLARRSLREMIQEVEWLDLVGEATDGRQAVTQIDELKPDLVFLDVRMPELSGIEVLETVTHDPAIVFTTAYDRYAVTAFELEAIDYLIKPFGRRRFLATLDRVRKRLDAAEPDHGDRSRARSALRKQPIRRLFARKGDRIFPIPIEAIIRIESCDDYCMVHADGKSHLLNLRLTELAARLDPERFLRVHRSHIVNLEQVSEMVPHDERRLMILLRDGSEVVASRAGSQRLRELIG